LSELSATELVIYAAAKLAIVVLLLSDDVIPECFGYWFELNMPRLEGGINRECGASGINESPMCDTCRRVSHNCVVLKAVATLWADVES
jgi:hypothetical protein